jgi:hypothetical protein
LKQNGGKRQEEEEEEQQQQQGGGLMPFNYCGNYRLGEGSGVERGGLAGQMK